MSSGYARWSDVRARGRTADPRTREEQAAGKAGARERREAYVRGHQLAEMRTAAGLTQAELAETLGVSQARVSKIEHGEISGIDVVRRDLRPGRQLSQLRALPHGQRPVDREELVVLVLAHRCASSAVPSSATRATLEEKRPAPQPIRNAGDHDRAGHVLPSS
jgi:transcriptional regulator with XRE-family HTH domain